MRLGRRGREQYIFIYWAYQSKLTRHMSTMCYLLQRRQIHWLQISSSLKDRPAWIPKCQLTRGSTQALTIWVPTLTFTNHSIRDSCRDLMLLLFEGDPFCPSRHLVFIDLLKLSRKGSKKIRRPNTSTKKCQKCFHKLHNTTRYIVYIIEQYEEWTYAWATSIRVPLPWKASRSHRLPLFRTACHQQNLCSSNRQPAYHMRRHHNLHNCVDRYYQNTVLKHNIYHIRRHPTRM